MNMLARQFQRLIVRVTEDDNQLLQITFTDGSVMRIQSQDFEMYQSFLYVDGEIEWGKRDE